MKNYKFTIPFWLMLAAIGTLFLIPASERMQAKETPLLGTHVRFLPVALRAYPIEETLFGIEAQDLSDAGGLGKIDEAGAYWVRRNAVNWAAVEPNEGARVWGAIANLETQLNNARAKGLEVILIVRNTPTWAQAVPNYSCGKIKQDKLAAFANFMHDLVLRYSVPPYEVKYWELWNEPDVAPAQMPDPDAPYGCWGDTGDPNFGGGFYADMLEAVYPQVKSADSEAQVIVGGLLLDCDPRIPGACTTMYGDAPSKFLNGILANNGAAFFDGVAFHAYDFYQGSLGGYGNQNWSSYWYSTGPVSSAKKDYIEEVLASYAVGGKFIMNTESALICDNCTQDPIFELTKAYYLAQSYAEAISDGLRSNIWFSILGWRNSGLVNPDLSPRPAFTAFGVSRNLLQDASPLGAISLADISPSAGVAGYKFQRNGKQIWILWSRDGLPHTVSILPGVPDITYDVFGGASSPSNPVTINLDPVYFVWD